MGVSLPAGGGKGGRTRNLNADLNLVPFIDLLSVCITFLLATAVWVQTSALEVEQSIAAPNTVPQTEQQPVPPLSIHIKADGIWMGRKREEAKDYPLTGDAYDWATLEADLKVDHETYPSEVLATIVTDDGVHYEHMITALDLTRRIGYEKTLLGGGPASADPLGGMQ